MILFSCSAKMLHDLYAFDQWGRSYIIAIIMVRLTEGMSVDGRCHRSFLVGSLMFLFLLTERKSHMIDGRNQERQREAN